MFSSVDLPQPEGPITATNSPASICRLTSLSACVSTSVVRYTLPILSSFNMKDSSLNIDAVDTVIAGVVGGDHAFARREAAENLQLLDDAAPDANAPAVRDAVVVERENPVAATLLQERTHWQQDGGGRGAQREFSLHCLAGQQLRR